MPRKRKVVNPEPLIETPVQVVYQFVPQPHCRHREAALAKKRDYKLSCLQEAGLDWRLVYTQDGSPTSRWLVAIEDYQCVTFDSWHATEFEATQRFHEILREWPK